MIDDQRVLAVITARGGSKGLAGKNIRLAAGKPLLAWTILAALQSKLVDRVITSTDSEEIKAVALQYGSEVPFMRTSALSTDETASIDVVLDALDRLPGYDYVVLLQPTSPLRTGADIDGAIRLCHANAAPACVSVCRATQSPFWMYTVGENRRISPLIAGARVTRRQDLPPVYVLNGAVYVARPDSLRMDRSFITSSSVAYEMPGDRSIDIDTEFDLGLAETRLPVA